MKITTKEFVKALIKESLQNSYIGISNHHLQYFKGKITLKMNLLTKVFYIIYEANAIPILAIPYLGEKYRFLLEKTLVFFLESYFKINGVRNE